MNIPKRDPLPKVCCQVQKSSVIPYHMWDLDTQYYCLEIQNNCKFPIDCLFMASLVGDIEMEPSIKPCCLKEILSNIIPSYILNQNKCVNKFPNYVLNLILDDK